MNIYLDIDGTLLYKNKKIIKNLKDFLTLAFSKGDVYWLTTHCRENNNQAVLRHLEPFVSVDEMALLKKIKTTEWRTLKTEAIDFEKPFLWFDDFLFLAEREILKNAGVFDCWIEIDLSKDVSIDISELNKNI
jgi:hypothetical protein